MPRLNNNTEQQKGYLKPSKQFSGSLSKTNQPNNKLSLSLFLPISFWYPPSNKTVFFYWLPAAYTATAFKTFPQRNREV
ncbi:hypothetical protein EIKCOROL_01327 [Eikenella corrodens ATCC 23834]|uniref:Uncharacterized protein n=1 Tax=Eikenella corrodens ATCC 23834 TaxID=546274 RepID=C0DVD8_EIKCO|nr:hypothetical protein EIKCOROL_01327 [Eikenella corrodens ATCC 23834]